MIHTTDFRAHYQKVCEAYSQRFYRMHNLTIMKMATSIFRSPLEGRNHFDDLMSLQLMATVSNKDKKTAGSIHAIIDKFPLFLPSNLAAKPLDVWAFLLGRLDWQTLKILRLVNKAWAAFINIEDLFQASLTSNVKLHDFYVWENILLKVNGSNIENQDELLERLGKILFKFVNSKQRERVLGPESILRFQITIVVPDSRKRKGADSNSEIKYTRTQDEDT